MYTKVINPQKHGAVAYNNTGSCQRLVNYLNKENAERKLEERELFFNQHNSDLSSNTVIHAIDNNKKGVAKGRAVFHSLVIAPDKDELKHIKYNQELLKAYTIKVMEEYAANFLLSNNRKLTINDLVWFGKLELLRNDAHDNGNNMHVHIIVSTRDANQKLSLSPNTNDKKRFNRVNFALKSERAFDRFFGYERENSRLYSHQMRMHGSVSEKMSFNNTQSVQDEREENLIGFNGSSDYIPIAPIKSITDDNTQNKKHKKKRKKPKPKRGFSRD